MDKLRLTLLNTWTSIYPPLGLLYISAYLKKYLNFFNISLVESEKTELGVAERVLKTKPDLVGITSSTPAINQVVAIAKEIKKCGIPIVLGGPHITSLPHRLPNEIDVGIIGEGEQTMLELLRLFLDSGEFKNSKLKKVKGICFHNDYKVKINGMRELIEPLDTIPYPARDLLDMKRYLKPCDILSNRQLLKGTTILTSRGCPYNCVYCQASQQWRKIRFHSSEYVVNEIKYITERYKIDAINIIDDLCISNKERLKRIANLLKKEGLNKKLVFNINGIANLIDDERCKLLKEMNVVQVSIGFESGSEKILKYLKKGMVTIKQNKKAILLAKKYGVPVGGQFMLGTPGETKNDLMKTFEFIKTFPMSHVNLNITTPLPGTELWTHAKRRGLVNDNMNWEQLTISFKSNPNDNFYIGDRISKEDFLQIYKEIKDYCDIVNAMPIYSYFQFSRFPLLAIKAILHPKKAFHVISNSLKKKFRKRGI